MPSAAAPWPATLLPPMKADRPKRRTLQPPVPLPVGTRLGRYEVRNVLGSGAFGVVYRVLDADTDEELAVREYLPTHLAQRDGATQVVLRSPDDAEVFAAGLRFFVNEGKLLPKFDHPSLVKVHDAWEANGTAYMAMALVAGRTLADTHLTRWKAPRESALRAMLDALLGALEPLHQAGLQHRDIAPQTIVVALDGRPVLLDLGAPRRVMAARGDTGPTGPRDGYAPIELYAAPAQAAGHKRGPWSDIYSLGATIYFLMTDKAPPPAGARQPGDRLGLRLARHTQRHSLAFLAVLDWMLAPQPADRPQSVAQLRDALAGQGVPAAHQPSRAQRLAETLRRHQRWVWGASLLVLAGGVWLGVRYLVRHEIIPGLGG
jgi:serine/threonine protein kinase